MMERVNWKYFILCSYFLRCSSFIPKDLSLKSYLHRGNSILTKESSLQDKDVWTTRRKMIRGVLSPIIKSNLDNGVENKQNLSKQHMDDKLQFLFSALIFAIGVLCFRFGGRLAFIQFLGLDFMTKSDVNEQVNSFITYFQGLQDIRILLFLSAWIVVKLFCLDPLTIILALSSGILFGGIWQGTLASVFCATTASFISFSLSRYIFRDRARQEIEKRPAFRAVDRACSKEGFKTVFVLRLSPVIPIPVAAYSYLYGATSLSVIDFLLGTALGSAKPYALDAYLGMVGKDVLDEATTGGGFGTQNDGILLAVFAVVIVVGGFATQIATRTWDELQREVADTQTQDIPLLSSDTNSMTGSRANDTSAGMDWNKMLGIQESDVPEWIRKAKGPVDAAWDRVNTVVVDEFTAIKNEIKEGKELDENLIGWNGEKSNTTTSSQYPGERRLQPYELDPPSIDNISRYTMESMLFSFVVMSAALALLRTGSL